MSPEFVFDIHRVKIDPVRVNHIEKQESELVMLQKTGEVYRQTGPLHMLSNGGMRRRKCLLSPLLLLDG